MRYTHRLSNQDFFRIEPFSKEAVRAMMSLSSENEVTPSTAVTTVVTNEMIDQAYYCGFAKLKIFLDNWNPVNLWANETLAEGDRPMVTLNRPKLDTSADAILVLGPIIGVPYRIAKEDQEAAAIQEDKKQAQQGNGEEEKEIDREEKILVSVPVMIEVDRVTSMTILVTGVVNGEKLEISAQNVKANIPIVLEIGPLEKDERYLIQIMSGVKPSPYNDFIISTHLHWDETNIVILNAELTKEMNPSTILITDLTQRCSIPYNGVNAVVHTNFQPNFEAMIQEHQYNQVLVDGLSNYRRRGRPSARLKHEVNEILSAFREKFRDLLSRPSYRELLKSSTSHIFLPQVTIPVYAKDDVPSEVLVDGEGRLQRATRLLQLIESRVIQEYVDQLRYPGCNVYRSISTAEIKQQHYPEYDAIEIPDDGAMTREQLQQLWIHYVRLTADLYQETSLPMPKIIPDPPPPKPVFGKPAPAPAPPPPVEKKAKKRNIFWCLPQEDTVDSILTQWHIGCNPAPVVWLPWLSLNTKVSLEVFPVLTKAQLPITYKLMEMFTNYLTTRKMMTSLPPPPPPPPMPVNDTDSVMSENSVAIAKKKEKEREKQRKEKEAAAAAATVVLTEKQFSAQRSFGCTRLIFINGQVQSNESPEELFLSTSEVTIAMVKHLHEWKTVFPHRDYTFVCPSNKYGTLPYQLQAKYSIPSPLPPMRGGKLHPPIEISFDFTVHLIDTIYRSNEFDRRYHMAQRERHFQVTRRKIGAAAGKSKRAQQKREEEERLQRATIMKEVQEVMSKQVPDGYLVVKAFTTTILSTPDPPPVPPTTQSVEADNTVMLTSSEELKEREKEKEREGESKVEGEKKEGEDREGEKKEEDKKEEEKVEGEGEGVEGEKKEDKEGEDDDEEDEEKKKESEEEKEREKEREKEEQSSQSPAKEDTPSPPPYDPYAHIDVLTSFTIKTEGDKVAQEVQATGSLSIFDDNIDPAILAEREALKNYDKFITLQLPMWMIKLLLPSETVFVQDEILLVMRQSAKTKRILDRIESGEFTATFTKFYENSRLSELSRPEDLREVDLTVDGIIPIFFKDVVNRIWEYGLPDDVKARMLNLTDSFVRAYCFSRAMPNQEILSSSVTFAQAVNHACIMSIAMKTARRMSRNPKYQYLMDVPDPAAIAVIGIEKEEEELEEKKIALEIEKAEIIGVEKLLEAIRTMGQKKTKYNTKKENEFGSDVVQDLEERDRRIKSLEEEMSRISAEMVNYDSDIEELDREIEKAEKLQEAEDNQWEDEDEKAEKAREEQEKEREIKREMDAALDAEMRMEKEELAKVTKERTEFAHKVAEELMSILAEEEINKAAERLAPMLRVESIVYERPKKTRDEQRAASIKHMQRLKAEREKMRTIVGPRLIHMN